MDVEGPTLTLVVALAGVVEGAILTLAVAVAGVVSVEEGVILREEEGGKDEDVPVGGAAVVAVVTGTSFGASVVDVVYTSGASVGTIAFGSGVVGSGFVFEYGTPLASHSVQSINHHLWSLKLCSAPLHSLFR